MQREENQSEPVESLKMHFNVFMCDEKQMQIRHLLMSVTAEMCECVTQDRVKSET